MFARGSQLRSILAAAADAVVDWALMDAMPADAQQHLHQAVTAELEWLRSAQQPWLAAIRTSCATHRFSTMALVRDGGPPEREQILALRGQLAAHSIHVPEHANAAFAANLEQARAKLTVRGKLGAFTGELRQTLDQCQVDGSVPATAEAVLLCQLQIQLTSCDTR